MRRSGAEDECRRSTFRLAEMDRRLSRNVTNGPYPRLRGVGTIALSPEEVSMSEFPQHKSRAAGAGFEVLANVRLSPNVNRLEVIATRIAQIRRPGQFVIVHVGPGAERIPLTIADADEARGSITLIVQAVGKSTRELVDLMPGQVIQDIVGPLGRPTELIHEGRVVCVGGGLGTAVLYPIAQALHGLGTPLTIIVGARSKGWVLLADELAALGDLV